MNSLIIIAVGDGVWLALIAILIPLFGIIQTIVQTIVSGRQLKTQSDDLNKASKERSDKLAVKVDQQSEKVAEHVATKVAEASTLAPQKVEVVNKEPIAVQEVQDAAK